MCSGGKGRCWQLGAPRKFTATSRVVKGKINTTDTRGAECGLGTAIQAHCSDQVPAELMALTASRDENERDRERRRRRGGEAGAGQRLRTASVLLRSAGRMLMRSNIFAGKARIYVNPVLLFLGNWELTVMHKHTERCSVHIDC